MVEQRSRRAFLTTAGTTGVLGLAGCTGFNIGSTGSGQASDGDMLVFHAGSLAAPFATAEPVFEEATGIDVVREAKGSVASTKKITEQGRSADVLGVSDFRLMRERIIPDFGDWYAIFTTNAMSIQYRENAPGADEISTGNWWEILGRDDVAIGHSDPAVDPGGYRAVMTQQLGAIEFQGERLYDDATYQQLRANSVVPTDTETNLEGQLESGELDYVFYYRSLSESSDLPHVELQPEVDLSMPDSEYAMHYRKAAVETDSGTFTGAPIAYGLGVPGVAESPQNGARWVEYFATEPGQDILTDHGLRPVSPIVVPNAGTDAVPERVMQHAEARETLGPLEL